MKFKRRDTSREHPGKVFYQYKNGHEYWVTPERYDKNEAVRKKLLAKWQREHPEKCKQYHLKWVSKPGKLEIKRRAYHAWIGRPQNRLVRRKITQRYLSTVNGKLINCVRSRIAQALKRGHTKSVATLELIGCSLPKLRQHLESQFQPGMNWDNWNAWEIDHRVPLSSFNLADPEQQKLAFNFHNCQPMWKEANRQKSDKIEGELFRGRDIAKIIPFKAA